MDVEKLELLQRFSMLMGPRLDRNLLRNILMALTLVTDQETGEDLMKVVQKIL